MKKPEGKSYGMTKEAERWQKQVDEAYRKAEEFEKTKDKKKLEHLFLRLTRKLKKVAGIKT